MKLVDNVINSEYYSAALDHGRINHSDHESYAIIKEEFDEHMDEVVRTSLCLEEFWKLVKADGCDDAKLESLKELDRKAMLAACEIIQVAAMARKAMLTIDERSQAK